MRKKDINDIIRSIRNVKPRRRKTRRHGVKVFKDPRSGKRLYLRRFVDGKFFLWETARAEESGPVPTTKMVEGK